MLHGFPRNCCAPYQTSSSGTFVVDSNHGGGTNNKTFMYRICGPPSRRHAAADRLSVASTVSISCFDEILAASV